VLAISCRLGKVRENWLAPDAVIFERGGPQKMILNEASPTLWWWCEEPEKYGPLQPGPRRPFVVGDRWKLFPGAHAGAYEFYAALGEARYDYNSGTFISDKKGLPAKVDDRRFAMQRDLAATLQAAFELEVSRCSHAVRFEFRA